MDYHDALAAYEADGTIRGAARMLGVDRNVLRRALRRGNPEQFAKDVAIERDELPDRELTADELRERRRQKFARVHAAEQAAQLQRVRVRTDAPICIWHCGDPHLDDDGTDIALLERHIDIVNDTPGMFAATVGDMTNNWTGRLARLHGEQSTTAREAWTLTEWFVSAAPWLYIIGGNHDVWSGAGDPLVWLCRAAYAPYTPHGARIALEFDNGRQVRINARHDFRGHSQWNTAHGPSKAAQMGWRDHVLVAGHKHTSGYAVLRHPDPTTGIDGGLVSHALRIATYKVHDSYATSMGLPNQALGPCCCTIINPRATSELNLVQVIWDPEQAADYLTWLRRKEAV